MSVKEPADNDTVGTKEDLIHNTIDPSEEIDEELGHKKWLVWESTKDEHGRKAFIAKGKDGTVYRLVQKDEPEPEPEYKMIIEDPNTVVEQEEIKK